MPMWGDVECHRGATEDRSGNANSLTSGWPVRGHG